MSDVQFIFAPAKEGTVFAGYDEHGLNGTGFDLYDLKKNPDGIEITIEHGWGGQRGFRGEVEKKMAAAAQSNPQAVVATAAGQGILLASLSSEALNSVTLVLRERMGYAPQAGYPELQLA